MRNNLNIFRLMFLRYYFQTDYQEHLESGICTRQPGNIRFYLCPTHTTGTNIPCPSFHRLLHVRPTHAVSGKAVNPDLDATSIETQYFSTQPRSHVCRQPSCPRSLNRITSLLLGVHDLETGLSKRLYRHFFGQWLCLSTCYCKSQKNYAVDFPAFSSNINWFRPGPSNTTVPCEDSTCTPMLPR